MSSRDRTLKELHKLLSGIQLFAGLRPQLLTRLASASRMLELPAHRALFRCGDPISDVHFLVSGSVKRSAHLADQVEKLLELAQPGQMLAMSEVFCAKTYGSFAETVKASSVLAIPLETLIEIAGKAPDLSWRLLETMAQRQYAAEFEMVSHHSVSGTQRVLDYLLRLAGDRLDIAGETTVSLDASKKLIAARLDMTPETFSRTLRLLSADGVIVVNGRVVHIQNATLGIGGRGDKDKAVPPLRYPKMDRTALGDVISPAALVNLCGRHRVLSQRMAIAWCMIARKISPQSAKSALRKYRDQFERNLAKVSSLPLQPALRCKLEALRDIWKPYVELLTAPSPDAAGAGEVFKRSEQILKAADLLTATSAIEGGTNEILCVNIAGRNRMLSARLTKLFLFCHWPECAGEAGELMNEARLEFDRNIMKLRDNGGDLPEIAAQLSIDIDHWRHLINTIDARKHSFGNNTHARAVLGASEGLLRHVDTTVKLYERLAEKCSPAASAA